MDRVWLESQRQKLASEIIDAPKHFRILAIGRKVNGQTDIVACMERGLRNLGHHVLFIDLKQHPRITDNPGKLQGGYGPIHVRLDDIRRAVLRFRPQIVMCLAGGLAFRDEDADWLKRQGAVVIGLTLSDPDVFESIQSFAGSFDFHTTNALVALEKYHAKGLTNTLLFPFAVDRAFACQNVPHRNEFDADVICLGHATAHPVRDGVMSEVHRKLGSRFKVTAYGRGWSLPGSRLVEGLEVMQASRGAQVHVNFPMTRAGFINVKCGVFETVASGGLLVTKRFTEMERYFDYDSEIAGYNELEDLPSVLDRLLSNKEDLERRQRASFVRLVSSHLYEHRWLDLIKAIEDTVARSPDKIGRQRSAEVQDILSTDMTRARLVSLSGFYGARNIGDDLIMESIASSVEEGAPGTQVVIVAQNPRTVELEYGRQAVARSHHHETDALVAKSDAFLLGGGGLWHDYTFDQAGGIRGMATGATNSIAGVSIGGMLAHIRGIPFHVVGLGVGPLTNPDAKLAVKFAASLTSSLMVRDEDSVRLLRDSGVPTERITLAPDVVYALDLDGETPAELLTLKKTHALVGVNLRPWQRSDVSISTLAAEIADAVRAFAKELGRPVAVVLLPLQEGATYDRQVLQDFASTLSGFEIYELPSPLEKRAFIGTLKALDLVVSMRLHCCLLSHRLGVPVVGLAYDPKLTAHFGELGRDLLALPLEASANAILAAMKAARSQPPGAMKHALDALSTSSRAALRNVAAAIAASERRQVVWGIDTGAALHERPATSAPGKAAATAAGKKPAKPVAKGAATVHAPTRHKGANGAPIQAKAPAAAAAKEVFKPAPFDARSFLMYMTGDAEEDVPMLLQQAERLIKGGDYENARAVLKEARRLDQSNSRVLRLMIDACYKSKNWSKLTYFLTKARDFGDLRDFCYKVHVDMCIARDNRAKASMIVQSLPDGDPLKKDLLEKIRAPRSS